MPQQLPLGVSLDDDARFDNFYLAPDTGNALALASVQSLLAADGESYVCLWGGAGVGLSHLAQALCHAAGRRALAAQYLPLAALVGQGLPEEMLAGLEQLDLVCLDDLDAAVGRPGWEQALFHLFNRLRDAGCRLLITAHDNPAHLPVLLADLKSRLAWGLCCQLQALSDRDKGAALQLRAKARGLVLADEVAAYILARAPRDMNRLFGLLSELDRASLREKRRLTIPFVRELLS